MSTTLACDSIFAAQEGLVRRSLGDLLIEYGHKPNDLTKLDMVLAALQKYNVSLSPTFDDDSDLKLNRVLKRKRPNELLHRKIQEMLEQGGESLKVELKSSLAIDTKFKAAKPGLKVTEYVNEKLRTKLAQEICAFLNADGGEIFLGISNEHEIIGCKDDLEAAGLSGSEQDQADLLVRKLIDQKFQNSKTVQAHLQVQCTTFQGEPLITIEIAQMQSLAFLKPDTGSSAQLYKRIGTSAEPILVTDIEKYYEVKALS